MDTTIIEMACITILTTVLAVTEKHGRGNKVFEVIELLGITGMAIVGIKSAFKLIIELKAIGF